MKVIIITEKTILGDIKSYVLNNETLNNRVEICLKNGIDVSITIGETNTPLEVLFAVSYVVPFWNSWTKQQ